MGKTNMYLEERLRYLTRIRMLDSRIKVIKFEKCEQPPGDRERTQKAKVRMIQIQNNSHGQMLFSMDFFSKPPEAAPSGNLHFNESSS